MWLVLVSNHDFINYKRILKRNLNPFTWIKQDKKINWSIEWVEFVNVIILLFFTLSISVMAEKYFYLDKNMRRKQTKEP